MSVGLHTLARLPSFRSFPRKRESIEGEARYPCGWIPAFAGMSAWVGVPPVDTRSRGNERTGVMSDTAGPCYSHGGFSV
jgi:hypothetical protein